MVALVDKVVPVVAVVPGNSAYLMIERMKILPLIVSILLATPALSQVKGGPEDFARKRVEIVMKATKISEQQEKALTTLFLETIARRDEIFADRQPGGGKETQAKIQKLRDEETAKIKKILSSAQFKAYEAHLEKLKQEAEQRRIDQEKK